MRLRNTNRLLKEAVGLLEADLYNFNGKILGQEDFFKLVVAKMTDGKGYFAIMNWNAPGLPKDIFDVTKSQYRRLKVKEISYEEAVAMRKARKAREK